ncbi:transcriptional regulator, MarR family [Caminicella sporogenes DSM 14501]|uniref:Transcriptional regulator, MarR family n=1 Tax=Caminicella sporogenes DSM 14501 TaxID=1121266 RepID=A0A1M6QWU9_9FIRM|nr:MarR family transcriptional regulator [Caminicella sporogenes]RKD20876.1 MarR family transcriptional regulator [Caminicella sporogenes]SHK24752.1 transcriptional regulator, MarR family [Caminicella sporogenes DSM 14501]
MRCLDNSIGKWISILHRYAKCYIDRELKTYNIGSGQFIFLVLLFKKDGINQEDISKIINIDKGTTARALKKLEKEGYIKRQIDPDDKRAYKVYITEKALSIKSKIFNVLKKWTDILSSDFTEEEKELALKLLQKMSQNASNYIKKNYK